MRGFITRPLGQVLVAVAIALSAGGVYVVATPAPSGSCDLNATTSTFSTQVAAATAGQTLCLASGSYGNFAGVNKSSPGITIKEQDGATATLGNLSWSGGSGSGNIGWFTLDGIDYTGGTICAPAHDITIKNATQTGYLSINPGAGPGANNACSAAPAMANANMVWDNVVFTLSACPTGSCLSSEGRVSILYGSASPAGITFRNSRFTGNCADGIQLGNSSNAGRGVLVEDSTFDNLLQASCAPHVDSIQFVGGCCLEVRDSYFHDNSTGIVSYDAPASGVTIDNTVFVNIPSGACDAVCIGGSVGTSVTHSTFKNAFMTNSVNHDGTGSTGTILRDTIMATPPGSQGSSSFAVQDYNICLSGTCTGAHSLNGAPAPTWVGGASPSTWAGFALSGGSRGENVASDGTDIGVNP